MKQEFNWAMDQVKLPPEAEERILRALEKKQSCFRRRSKHWWRLVLAVAAVLALLVGTAIATTYQAGILGIFFQGDTSSLEPYVETKRLSFRIRITVLLWTAVSLTGKPSMQWSQLKASMLRRQSA